MFYVEFSSETNFLRRLLADFVETLPHEVGSSANNFPSAFCSVPTKRN